jgi:MFS family permease
VIGVLAGLPAGALVPVPAAALRPASRAPGMGLFYTWYYAGMAVLPGVAGWLEDVVGRAAAIEFAAAAILVALASYLAFRRLVAGDGELARTA